MFILPDLQLTVCNNVITKLGFTADGTIMQSQTPLSDNGRITCCVITGVIVTIVIPLLPDSCIIAICILLHWQTIRK